MAGFRFRNLSFSSDDDEDIFDFLQVPAKRPRIFNERKDYFELFDNVDFITRFRISKESALIVLQHIEEDLEYDHDRNNSLSPMNQLLLTLRFYATGCHLITAADFIGVSKPTACRVVHRVTELIAALRPHYINLPTAPEEMAVIQRNFYGLHRFPRVIGALDCTHIKIQSPGGELAEVFRNRKGFFSINVQTISDSNLLIRDIVARWPGSAHDTTIFNNCEKRAMFETGRYGNSLLIADSGYPVRSYLLTPLDNATNRAEQLYNESLIRTRNCVERQYGVWKRKFPILALGMRVAIPKVLDIIVACAVLCNLSRQNGDVEPVNEIENIQARIDEDHMPNEVQIRAAMANRNGGNVVRQSIVTEYFQTLI